MADDTEMNEAELEARIAGAITAAFPYMKPGDVRHQLRFSVKLGRTSIEVGGKTASSAQGRCDVLLLDSTRPLAVLELKRPGLALTDDDRDQGLSYARLTQPWAPLVVVTNGDDTRLFSTFDGKALEPESASEEKLASLFAQTAKFAKSDLRNAVETLIGPNTATWIGLVRSISQSTLDDLTGRWEETLSPFADGLMFPRKASAIAVGLLEAGAPCVIVAGAPLSGKSNVLREIALRRYRKDNCGVLFVDAGAAGNGILQTIANAMTKAFGWSITTDDVRAWLIQLSHADDRPPLLLVIDDANADAIRGELDEFTSNSYGPQLRLVLSIDEAMVDTLTRNSTGRQLTRLGKVAEVLALGPLDDEEFEAAALTLRQKRIELMRGARRTPEYRTPWMLRWVAADAIADENYANENLVAAIPSMPGLMAVQQTRKRFSADQTLVGQYTTIAEAVLDDLEEHGGSVAFFLKSVGSFICCKKTALTRLGDAEFSSLAQRGYVKEAMLEDNERIVVAQIPELLISTLATVLSARLREELKNGVDTATENLVRRCGRLFTGDLLGAQAIMEAALASGGLPLGVIEHLLQSEPRREKVRPGTRAVVRWDENTNIDIEFGKDGKLYILAPNGKRIEAGTNDEDQVLMSDVIPWQILSHLASLQMAAVRRDDPEIIGLIDPELLIRVGSCPQPLRPFPTGVDNVLMYELPGQGSVVCQQEGIVEPITYALMRAMAGDRDAATHIIDRAMEDTNIPLLARLHIALLEVSKFNDKDTASWARTTLDTIVRPAMSELLHA